MRILSNFKDYYDYVSHLYGEGDVYKRVSFQPPKGTKYPDLWTPILDVGQMLPKNLGISYGEKIRGRWLCVAGVYYVLTAPVTHTHFDDDDLSRYFTVDRPKWQLDMERTRKAWMLDTRSLREARLEAHRFLNAPVFALEEIQNIYDTKYRVDRLIPILGDLGFARIKSATQLYQDLSYFIGNTMKVSPELSPPSTMTDKEKIVSHGFDLIQSFRHRKKS